MTTLYSFAGGTTDGLYPMGQLLQGSDGNLYGATLYGGNSNCPVGMGTNWCGVVFKVTPEGGETILLSGPDVAYPNAPLIQGSDGNFYGTTEGGGSANYGTVFEITPEGVVSTLYSFSGGSDGCGPAIGLSQGSDGNFYGMTAGCGANTGGTVFQLTPAGVLGVLYSFPLSLAGLHPNPGTNLVQGSDGNLYGTTEDSGAYSRGIFFRLVLK